MRRRDRESIRDIDSHDGLFFGSDDDTDLYGEHDGHTRNDHGDERQEHHDHDDDGDHGDEPDDHEVRPGERGGGPRPQPGSRAANGLAVGGSRLEIRRRSRNRRRKRALGVLAFLVVVLLGISVWFIGLPVYHYFFPKDYDGAGSGHVIVTIRANEGTGDIGKTLEKAGVVGSERAFTDAASDNERARNIQPGSYKLRKHMAATQALTLLLRPSSRIDSDTVVTEGATVVDVEKRLVAPPCASSGSETCGLGLSKAEVTKALTNVKALGLPTDYLRGGRTPASVEGFLFPATYTFDDETTVTEALQQMVGKFTDQARSTEFSAKAKAVNLTPYQALTIASIAQAEAKFPEDFAKVARVIMNRLAARKPLQVDATSAYAAKLRGVDPTEEIYAETKGPFNTYTNAGLPPTPIGNPGEDAMTAAVTPAKGSWMYYVNRDAAGHLGFYSDEKSFTKAQQRCHDEGWGCAAP